jgi:hypothetical protein
VFVDYHNYTSLELGASSLIFQSHTMWLSFCIIIYITYSKSQGFKVYKSQTKVILLDEKHRIKILEIKKCTFFGFALAQVEIFLGNVVE